MQLKCAASTLAALTLFCALLLPVQGISVTTSTGNGIGPFSATVGISLPDSGTARQDTYVGTDAIVQTTQMDAQEGSSQLTQNLQGNDYLINNIVDGTGSLSVDNSALTGSDAGMFSQDLSGSGDVSFGLSGSSGSMAAIQEAGVAEGDLSSTQQVVANNGVLASQSTDLTGKVGAVGSGASSEEDYSILEGGFQGVTTLQADLGAVAKDTSSITGSATMAGVECVDDELLGVVGSAGLGMSIQGLYSNPEEDFGRFYLRVQSGSKGTNFGVAPKARVKPSPEPPDPGSTLPETVLLGDDDDDSHYLLPSERYTDADGTPWDNWRWNVDNPQIQLYLRADRNLERENLDPVAVQNAIAAAANTWDYFAAQNLFAQGGISDPDDGQPVIVDPSKRADFPDGANVHAWTNRNFGPGAIAYSRTYYKPDEYLVRDNMNFYSAFESDVCYNIAYKWTTTGDPSKGIDVRSVALHELGHTLGLADIYGSYLAYDSNQIMNSYDDPQRSLGYGDEAGISYLYDDDQFT